MLGDKIFFAWGFKAFTLKDNQLLVYYKGSWYPTRVIDVA